MASALARRHLASAAARLNARHAMAGLLPSLVLMTDDARLPDPLAAARALPNGAMVVVRARDPVRRAALTHALTALSHLIVLVADDPALAARADGLHLPQAKAHEAAHWRARHRRWLLTAATHGAAPPDPRLDAAFLSPIFATPSHPGAQTLGAVRANAIAHATSIPLYALGGITAHNARLLHGFVGIAAIGALDI